MISAIGSWACSLRRRTSARSSWNARWYAQAREGTDERRAGQPLDLSPVDGSDPTTQSHQNQGEGTEEHEPGAGGDGDRHARGQRAATQAARLVHGQLGRGAAASVDGDFDRSEDGVDERPVVVEGQRRIVPIDRPRTSGAGRGLVQVLLAASAPSSAPVSRQEPSIAPIASRSRTTFCRPARAIAEWPHRARVDTCAPATPPGPPRSVHRRQLAQTRRMLSPCRLPGQPGLGEQRKPSHEAEHRQKAPDAGARRPTTGHGLRLQQTARARVLRSHASTFRIAADAVCDPPVLPATDQPGG